MPVPNAYKLAMRATRARSVSMKGIRYGFGHGGMNPLAETPADRANLCDCSGFALAWCFGISRAPKTIRPYWIATETVYADAMSTHPVTFVRIERPVAGCAVVYPDRNGEQGHCGLVTGATFDSAGNVASLHGVDCSSGQSRRTGEAITERDLTFFLKSRPIYVVLKEDLA